MRCIFTCSVQVWHNPYAVSQGIGYDRTFWGPLSIWSFHGQYLCTLGHSDPSRASVGPLWQGRPYKSHHESAVSQLMLIFMGIASRLLSRPSGWPLHPENKKCFQEPFLVLQLVTNRGLYSVPGRTKWYLEAPWQAYWGPDGQKIFLYHGPSRYHLVIPGTE